MAKLINDFFVDFLSGWEYANKQDLIDLLVIAFVIIVFVLIFKFIFWIFSRIYFLVLPGKKYHD